MPPPFLIERRAFEESPVHLLPTANVVLVCQGDRSEGDVRFVFPHRGIRVLDDVSECISLAPNFVKCLIGEPRRQLERMLRAADHPMLAPFAAITGIAGATLLLHDLRDSLVVTPDESDFIALWTASRAAAVPLPTGDRRVQRLCLRYAGQSPTVINTLSRLARTLDADNTSGLHNGLGEFADASHFARACRANTGRTPTEWRNMSHTFY